MELGLGKGGVENGVVENAHDFAGGELAVGDLLALGGRGDFCVLCGIEMGLGHFLVPEGEKLPIFLFGIEGVEDVSGFAEEAVYLGGLLGLGVGTCHE